MIKTRAKVRPLFKRKRDNYARKLKREKLIKYLQSELRSCTTHGLPYIVNMEIHWTGRLYWAISFVICLGIIVMLLSSQYSRYINSPVVMSVEMDYYNWNVSYPAITLCPASNIDQDVFSALVNETRNKTGKNLHSYYWSLGTISLETVDQIAVQTADVVKLLHTKDYAEIAAMLFESFDNGTFMTNINEPISIEPALTEMGMCHVINSNVAVLHNPIKWKDEAAAYVKNNIEISAHDVDFYTQIMNYAEVYKVYVHSPDEIAISTTPSFTYEAEGLLLFGYQYEPFYINDTHFNYISDHEKICDFNELLCVIRYKNEIIRLAPSNDTIAKFGHFSSLPRSSSDCGCLGSCEAQEYLKDQENFLAQESTSKLRIAISTFPSPIAKASNATNVVEGALEKSTVTEHCGPLSRRKALVPWKRACRMYAHITDPDFVLEEPSKSSSPKLFMCTAIENKDEIEERYERAYNYFQSLVADCSEKETHDALNNAACKNHEEVSLGMLMSILTEPHNATKCYRDLTLITRDGLTCVLNNLSNLILERYLKFQDTTRNQLLWLVKEMIRNSVTGIDSVCWNLMRYASGGDITPKNIYLVESLLEIYIENRAWLDKFPVLICMVVYTYLRIIEDHNIPQLMALRQKEVNFVISLIRERFADIQSLGRDMIRLLQNVARIPEFGQLWQDILTNPKSLCPTFTNVLQILQTRTSRRYLQSRLTPDMERKLVFLTSQVRFGHHKRYQEWFQRQYLATPESQSLRSDMIRFIVGVIHPTNELLCSDIIPRWAVIGWLLTTCTSNVAASNAKLALFYDWLFYDPEKDNIMNIEPAILVMHHSMRSHPAVTATLLDFLCRIIPHFYPPFADKVKQGIFSSLQQIIEKRVLPNLQPLFDSPKLDRELRTTVRETFKEFCSNGNGEGASGARDDGSEELPREPDEPAFSDDEEDAPPIIAEDTDDDDLPLSEVRARERPELAAALPLNLRPLAETLLDDRSAAAATALLNACSTSMPTATALADLFTAAVQEAPALRITANPTPAELDNAVNSPIFSMFNFLKTSGEGAEAKRKLILETFKEIRTQNTFHGVGYCLLFYLKVCFERDRRAEHDAGKRRNVKFKSELYRDYCSYLEVKIGDNLADDLEKCQECDANVLVWLIPDVYREFKDQAQNHIKLLHVIVSTVDAGQLQRLVCLTLQNNLMMFKSDDITTMLSTSLGWETFEQYCLWQLLTAHDISLEDVLPIIPKLSYKDHAEALTSVLLMLKQGKPSADVLRQLFCRSVQQEDTFVVSTLLYWCQDYEDKVGDLVSVLLSTRYPGTSPNKRKRPGKHSIPPNAPPSAELVLGHLEQMRVNCVEQDDMSIFNMECMQKSLQLSQSNSSDSLRRQYSELFLLAWEDELPISRRARKLITNSLPLGANLHSSNDDSEEEEIVKPKQAKRRKKAISDSD
ncbi:hypothetical protein MSG28_012338 [Choristoneura fumiferana]|uniref:Uncharacterized protein n=1 Tax=Choristoneura fumiferana TaxID=7141 RepID=A0ACC0KDU6_CHOFU|nr:hypothetical protein MSG28_012338 [Choristoneura fumiferana]